MSEQVLLIASICLIIATVVLLLLKKLNWVCAVTIALISFKLSVEAHLDSLGFIIEDDICGDKIYGMRIYQVVENQLLNKCYYICRCISLLWFIIAGCGILKDLSRLAHHHQKTHNIRCMDKDDGSV